MEERSDAKAAQIIGQHAKGIMAEEEEKEQWEVEQISILPLCIFVVIVFRSIKTDQFSILCIQCLKILKENRAKTLQTLVSCKTVAPPISIRIRCKNIT